MKKRILIYLIHQESKRIARGSGWPEGEVKELIKNYKNSKEYDEGFQRTPNARHT